MECIVDTCLCGILFYAIGFAFMFSHGNGFIGYHWFFLQDACEADGDLGPVGAGELSATHLAAVDQLVTGWHGQGPIQLPGGYEVSRTSGTLCIRGRDHRLEG